MAGMAEEKSCNNCDCNGREGEICGPAFFSGCTPENLKGWIPKQQETDPHAIPQHEPGAKLDDGKVMADLLLDMGNALLAVAEIGTFGAKKYSRGGWQSVPDAKNRYTAALMRHLFYSRYKDNDEDSGLLHDAHLAWNALARLELRLRDNRKEIE